MKRTLSLIVLLGLVVGAVATGCKPADDPNAVPATTEVDTNTPAPAAP